MKKLSTLILILSGLVMGGVEMRSQTPILPPDFGIPSLIAPAYFGPNAFPIPDMLDGAVSSGLSVELCYDTFLCTMTDDVTDDVTSDLFARVRVPLFSPRINIVLWMPVIEWFHTTSEINSMRRLPEGSPLSGFDSGDVYASTDIHLLEQGRAGFDLAVRAAMKTASGNSFSTARVYDAPGYFFDVAVGRDVWTFPDGGLRLAASTGFLCWQTDNGRQNDAVMYGFMAAGRTGAFSADAAIGGYVGWEGVGDRPMTLKCNVSWSLNRFTLGLSYQAGLNDWPYHQIRAGVSYSIPIY